MSAASGIAFLFGLGLPELALIFGIVIVVFGATKLPLLGKGLGEGISNFKSGLRNRDENPSLPAETKKIDEELPR